MRIKNLFTNLALSTLMMAALTFSGAASAQALNLAKGWNLLGNSNTASINVAATFADTSKITTVWKWNRATDKWAFYAPSMTTTDLAAYAASKNYEVLTSIASKDGFWVNAATAATLAGVVPGAVPLLAADTQKGWNMLGSGDNKTMAQLSQDLSSSMTAAGKTLVTAWAWNTQTGKWKFYAPALAAQGGSVLADYITSKAYEPFTGALAATEGFWLNISASVRDPVLLGTAGNFVILAKTAISTVPTSAITGDIGVSPAATSFLTGFSLTKVGTTSATASQVTGTLYGADMTTPTNSNLTTAVSNMEAAYTDAAGRTTPDVLNLGTGEIGGQTLAPGLYKWTTGVTISSDVTFAGGANDVWIMQIPGTLTMSSAKRITLSGGAMAKNIFWQVAGFAEIGTNAHFEGLILSQTEIRLRTGASMNGRALAQSQVTLDQNAVTRPVQ